MRIGILGSGRMGGTLGTLWARAGHEVVFSYARNDGKLARLAGRAGRHASVGTPREAAENADAVLLSVHWSRVGDVVRQTGPLAGQVVVTCSLPMNRADTALVGADTSSGAEVLARTLRRAHVVSAFGTVPSEVFGDVYANRRRANRPSLLYAGDDRRAKRLTARLIRDVGFDPLDAGPLRMARYLEPFTLLIAQLAYERPGGPRLAYRVVRFRGRA